MAKPTVLFVCVHNAGRSQMAAGWLRHLAGDTVEVRSAGSAPADALNPAVVEAMREVGIDLTDQTPAHLTWDAAEASDVIVTMGCGDACPACGYSTASRPMPARRPASCAATNAGTEAGTMPANVSVNARPTVTAGLANEVDEVNQYAAPM